MGRLFVPREQPNLQPYHDSVAKLNYDTSILTFWICGISLAISPVLGLMWGFEALCLIWFFALAIMPAALAQYRECLRYSERRKETNPEFDLKKI